MSKPTLATVWLDGCSGCHMSFLDIDERLLAVAAQADLVYSPLVDNKVFPEMVDITLVEGAVSSQYDLEKIQHIRQHTRVLVAMGDCAVTGNVPAMRNLFKVEGILNRAYPEQLPDQDIPPLLKRVRPVHQVVEVDVFVPGCPPSAETLLYVVSELLARRQPVLKARFG